MSKLFCAIAVGGAAVIQVCLMSNVSLAQSDKASVENTNSPSSGRPTNLCQELLAFVRQPATTVKASEPPAQLATAVSAKKSDDTSEKPSAPGTPQNNLGAKRSDYLVWSWCRQVPRVKRKTGLLLLGPPLRHLPLLRMHLLHPPLPRRYQCPRPQTCSRSKKMPATTISKAAKRQRNLCGALGLQCLHHF